MTINMKKTFITLKRIFPSAFAFLLATFALLVSSCDVGLGDSVDTEPPTLSISYPPIGSVICKTFVLSGSCADDEGVSSVSVSVTNSDTKTSYGTYAASVSGNSWSLNLNSNDGSYNGWAFPDGNYTVSAIATDSAGRTSGTSSLSFQIDNTAPIMVLSSPGVDASNDSSSPTVYGSKFNISGQIADDHTVSMSVKIFDSNKTELATYTESNIEIAGGTDISFAKYSASGSGDDLDQRFRAIYGDDASQGDKNYYAQIILSDSAKEYTDPASGGTGSGNSTSTLYLYDNVSSSLMSSSGLNLTIADIKKIYNKTSTIDSSTQESALSILNDSSKQTTLTKFSLNPDASPKYSVVGYSFDSLNNLVGNLSTASAQQTVSISAISGRNGTYIKPDSLKAYQFGPYESSEVTELLLNNIYNNTETYATNNAKALLIADNSTYNSSSVDSYSWPVSLGSTIKANRYYILAVTGEDVETVDFTNSDGNYYGFRGATTGTPPTIIWPNDNGNSVSDLGYINTSNLSFAGTTTCSDEGIESISYVVTVTDESTSETSEPFVTTTITGSKEDSSVSYTEDTGAWSFNLEAGMNYDTYKTTRESNPDKQYLFDIVVTVLGGNGQTTTKERRVHVDTTAPVVQINSVTPTVNTTDLNGEITIAGSVTETALSKIYYEIWSNGASSEPVNLGAKYSFSEVIDTTNTDTYKTADNETVKVIFYAKDQAGNVGSYSTTQYLNSGDDSGTTSFTINQASDKPVISLSNAKTSTSLSADQINSTNGNLFNTTDNKTLLGTLSDDDGIASYTITVYPSNSDTPVNASDYGLTSNPFELTGINSTTTTINFTLPNVEGKYKVVLAVKDTKYDEKNATNRSSSATYFVAVDKGAPIFSITTASGSYATNDAPPSVTGTVTDTSGVASIVCYSDESLSTKIAAYPAEEGYSTISYDPDSVTNIWSHSLPTGQSGTTITYYYVATDGYGNTTQQNFSYLIDASVPTWNADKTESDKKAPYIKGTGTSVPVDGEEDARIYYNTQNITIQAYAEDIGSGVDKLQYLIKGEENWTDVANGNFVISATEGINTIYIKALDKVGLQSQIVDITFYVDTTAPGDQDYALVSVDGVDNVTTKLTNADADITFTFNARDHKTAEGENNDKYYSSGIKSAALSKIGSTSITGVSAAMPPSYDETTDMYKYEITIPTTNITSSGTVTVRLTDNAGNYADFPLFTIQLDTTAPVVTINSPAESATVNKTISITGTASDNQSLKENVALYVLTDADTWTPILGKETATIQNGSWSFTEIDTTDTTNVMVYDSDKDSSNGTQLKIKVEATDSAGNVGSAERTITVDQDSDRPTVTFTNLDLTGMTSSNPVWLKNSTTLRGTVSDDDGISSIRIISSATVPEDSDWNFDPLTLGNGNSWTYNCSTDGSLTLYFQVIDANNTTFVLSTSSDTTPVYLSDGTNTFGDTKESSILYLRVDNSSPSLELQGISYDGLEITNANKVWDTSYSSLLFGGKTTSFQVKVFATDANGIKNLSATTKGLKTDTNADVSEVTYTTATKRKSDNTVASDGEEVSYYTFDNISCASGSGSMTLTITAEDNAGNTSSTSQQISVDNTAPNITFISPSSETTSSGTISVYGSVDSSTTLYYAVSPISVSPLSNVSPDEYNADTQFSWSDNNNITTILDDSAASDGDKIYQRTAYTQITDATLSWYLYFDGDTSGIGNHNKVLNDYLVDFYITTESELKAATDPFDSIVKLYVWIKAVDDAGNVTEEKHLIQLDPQGDRPTITIDYPSSDEVLGGTVRLSGSVNDNKSVKTAWVQIVSTAHTYNNFDTTDRDFGSTSPFSITKDDLDYLAHSDYSVYNMNKYVVDGDNTSCEWTGSLGDGESADDYAILATVSGGTSWNLRINGNGEFDPKTSTNDVAFRVYSIDDDGKISIPAERTAKFDSDNPIISNLYLKQETSASREYVDNMYVKGSWNLTGTVSDNDNIKSLSLRINSGSKIELSKSTDDSDDTWNFSYQLLTGNENVGSLTCEIIAEDNASSPHTTTQTLVINYDNQAPTLASTTDSSYNISGTIRQSNNFYTFGSKVTEASVGSVSQSGFERLAFYFVRRLTNNNYLYDVMLNKDATNNNINLSGLTWDSGLYWKEVDVTRDSNSLSVLTGVSADNNIRKGGLVKIGGYIYTITNVDGTSVTISGSPLVSETSALFAIASVVDNTVTESSGGSISTNTTGISGYYSDPLNDDGDKMIESVKKSGAEWTWEANICSKNIPDGPIELHYVAFDAAGNYSIGIVGNTDSYVGYEHTNSVAYTYTNASAFISNNAPRIAGVQVGTDYNGNDSIESDEWYTNFAASYTASETEYNKLGTSLTLEKTTGIKDSILTAKGITQIKPEIVGGNGNLYYSYKYPNGSTNGVSGNVSSSYFATGTSDYSLNNSSVINLQVGDLLKAGNSTTTLGNSTGVEYVFDIWDSTEGTSTFTNSQKAEIIMYIDIALKDSVAPTATINPFHWISSSDNSLYGNSSSNGHIELEADLPQEMINSFGDDPKVSGKIVITGSAHDNKRLSALYLSVPGMESMLGSGGANLQTTTSDSTTYYQMATYSSGTWTCKDSFDSNGFKFSVDTSTFNSDGHDVTWSFSWNTAKIANIAELDIKIQILAEDEGTPSYETGTGDEYTRLSVDGTTLYATDPSYTAQKLSAVSTTQTTTGIPTPFYQMDVVPYITGVTTSLSTLKKNNASVYSRTAQGHYPVRSDEEVTLSGFNLAADNADVIQSIADLTTSGDFAYTVNGVTSLNNMNSNDSKGSYEGTTTSKTGDYTVYNNYYNRQPNNDNNNNLTDDVVFDVWEFNSEAAKPISGIISDPVMKISPTSGMLGFAFTNGPLYFSMPGTVARNSRNNNPAGEYSYFYWQGSYDFMSSVGLAYDSAGYTYGCASGGDINATQADRFNFMTDRWGVSGAATGGSYGGTNALRLEAIAQYGDSAGSNTGTLNFDKTRIKSPSYATYRSGSSTNIYLAYFDNLNGEIRFKYGKLTDGTGKTDFNNFNDAYTDNTVNSGSNLSNGKYDTKYVQVIANEDGASDSSLGYSGEYLSIGATSDGKVVLVWYDSTNGNLMYSYNSSPTAGTTGKNKENWSDAITIFEEAGEYCQLVVDAGNGIHIAAYDGNSGDLKYAYLSAYNDTTPETCTVDSYAIVGQNITIDVAKESDTGKYIPHIGYYALSSARPKYAKLVGTSVADGVDSNDAYTGVWETSIIPTSSRMVQDRINVGVWKDSSTGVLKASTTGTSSASQYYGTCYGNGTSNAVLAYAIKPSSTSGFIETAQMK